MPSSPTVLPDRAYLPLPLGSVRARGWLLDQLRIQADGLTGHLDELGDAFPELGPDSGWLGGSGEHWEVPPYWLDGLVPLAWLLNDDRLKAKAHRWVGWTLDNIRADGWLGPETDHPDRWWPRAIMLKVMAQYHDATGDGRVLPAMAGYFDLLGRSLPEDPLHMWAKFRWADYLVSILWYCERRPCPAVRDLWKVLHDQGYHWEDHFEYFMIEDVIRRHPNLATHVVNHGMAVRAPALLGLFSGRETHRAASDTGIGMLDRFHGQATGVFTGDEHLAGRNPSRGTELCAVAEYMYSLAVLSSIYGNAAHADRQESLAYNNLPGTFTADMWSHQYDQQANQVQCTVSDRGWTNSAEANLYGLKPNYKCCLANFNQGFPKFVTHMWMGTPDGGLAAVAYGPSEVGRDIGGSHVTVTETTDYPFRGDIVFEMSLSGRATFPLHLRIPGWAAGARVSVNVGKAESPEPGTYHVIRRTWKNGDTVSLTLPMDLRVTRHFNDSAALHRGPLTFSLRIGQDWRTLRGAKPDIYYEVLPTSPWNYALQLDPEAPGQSVTVEERDVVMPCFSEENAPVVLRAKARRLPGWGIEDGSAAPTPKSPVTSSEMVETVELVPYGSAKLRVTEFPVLG